MRKLPHAAAESILEFIMRRYERGLDSAHIQSPRRGLGKTTRWVRRRPGVARPPPPPPPPLARAQMLATQLTHQGPHNLAMHTRHREVRLNSRLGCGKWPDLSRPPRVPGSSLVSHLRCIVFAQRPGDTGKPGSGTHLTLGLGTAGGRSGTESSAEPNKGQCVSTTKCFEERACRSFSDSTWTA